MSLRYAVLGLLSQEGGSGYDLLKRFDSSVAYVWPASQSQVYLELGRLTRDGLIEVTGVGARNRKEYAIRPAGRAALREWLSEPASEAVRSVGILQVFLLSEVDPEAARQHLDDVAHHAAERRAHLERLDREIPWDDSPRDAFARMALDYGIRQSRVHQEWAHEMRERLGAVDGVGLEDE